MFETVVAELHEVMEEVRERTFAARRPPRRSAAGDACSAPIMSPLVVGSRPRRRLRGPVAQPPARAGAQLLREDLAALYDAFETPRDGARRPRVPARRASCASTWRRCASARSRRRSPDGELHELVIRHELQHTETMLQAMALAGIAAAVVRRPAPVSGTGLEMVEVAEGPFELGAGREGFAYDNERPRHTRVDGAASRSAARRSPTPPGCTSPRAAATNAASGGPTRAGRGSEQYDITHHAAGRGRGPGRARRPRLLVRGRRLRPRPRGAPADGDRVGEGGDLGPARGRRARSGSGPRATSRATRVSSRTRTGSTPRCSSATATGCCAAARAPRTRASPPRSSATGTSPNAGSSSPESGSRDEDAL